MPTAPTRTRWTTRCEAETTGGPTLGGELDPGSGDLGAKVRAIHQTSTGVKVSSAEEKLRSAPSSVSVRFRALPAQVQVEPRASRGASRRRTAAAVLADHEDHRLVQ